MAEYAEIPANSTIHRICKEFHLYHRIARTKINMTADAKLRRFTFAQAHSHWDPPRWSRCIFTDEKGCCGDGYIRQMVWRLEDEAFEPEFMNFKPKNNVRVNFFGFVTGSSCGDLHIFPANGSGDAVATAFETLWPRILSLGEFHGPGLIGQGPPIIKEIYHDGPYFYTQQPVQVRLQALHDQNPDFRFITLPPYSPDINIIEHVWAFFENRKRDRCRDFLAQHANKGPNRAQLINIITTLWEDLRPEITELVQSLIESLPARMAEIIAKGGGHTRY